MAAFLVVAAVIVVLAVALLVDWWRSGRIKQAHAAGKMVGVPGRRSARPGTAGREAAGLRDNQGHVGGV
ncbi:hypothetical protein [Nocardioides nanhaiensis]|uniref:Uncharacterized protein n=1 Tax=Nocardioides nanhaiensis TaxID=1476871 RepID=A0ABP8W6V8_9ACTN